MTMETSELRFGTVLEHPLLRGLYWMVICGAEPQRDSMGNLHHSVEAICLNDDRPDFTWHWKIGKTETISGAAKDWIVVEP